MDSRTIATKRLRSTGDAVEVGRALIRAKQQLGHGSFLNYLQAIDRSLETAERCMRVARCVEEFPDILDLPLSMAYQVARVQPDQRAIAQARAGVRQKLREKDIEEAVVAQMRSQGIVADRQVQCAAGVIDIVTADAVYEVELFLSRDVFFHAIGQVLIYRQALDPTKRAIIIGLLDPGLSIVDLIGYARQFGVEVEFWTVPDEIT